MPTPPDDPVRRKTYFWLTPMLVFSSSNTHFLLHGTDPIVVLENVKSSRSSVSRPILLQEGLSILAVLAMVVTDERISHIGDCNDEG